MLNIRRRQRVEPALAPADRLGDVIPVLSCQRCDAPLASKEDLLDDGAMSTAVSSRSSPLSTACWAFELDVLETEVRCFSATDDAPRRIDFIRCGSAVARRCRAASAAEEPPEPSSAAARSSWFAEHRCACVRCRCGLTVGWRYEKDDDAANARDREATIQEQPGDSSEEAGRGTAAASPDEFVALMTRAVRERRCERSLLEQRPDSPPSPGLRKRTVNTASHAILKFFAGGHAPM